MDKILLFLKIFLTLIVLFTFTNSYAIDENNTDKINDLISTLLSKKVHWKVQIEAIKEIAKIPDPRGLEAILKIIQDPFLNYDCPALKYHSAQALGRFKDDSRVIETLINLASDDKNPLTVREVAINSLGEIGDKRALNTLIELTNHKSFALRSSAIRAMAKIKDPSVIPILESMLNRETDLKAEINSLLNILRKDI